jgi:tetratricopeptide (TPR) repeat protein
VIATLLLVLALASVGCSRESRSTRLLKEGKQQMAAGDMSSAIGLFARATQVSPPDPEAYYQLACANLLVGNGRTAAEELQKAIDLKPTYWDAQIKLAELMATSEEPAVLRDARENLLRTLQHVPTNAAALTALGIVEWKLGQKREAEAHLTQVLSYLPKHLNSRVALAKIKIASGDPASAETLLHKASIEFASSADLGIALAEFYIAMGQNNRAEAELNRILLRQPRNPLALINLAALQAKLDRKAGAEATYRILSSLPDPQYRSFFGLYLLESGKTGQAVEEFERLFKRYPADRTVRTLLVSSYMAAGRTEAAGRMLRSAVDKNNADYDALFQESVFTLGQGSLEAAQANITRALRIRPEAAEAHYLLAAVYLRRGILRSSMEELDETLAHNPQFLPARLALARFRIASKAPDAAIALLREAPPGQQNAPAVLAHTCWALLLSRDIAKFRKELESAMRRAPSPELSLQDALLRLEQGDRSASRRLAQELLQKDPEDLRGLFLLTRNWVVEQDAAAALQNMRRYADEHSKAPLVWQFLGELQLASGQPAAALASFERAAGEGVQATAADLGAASARLRAGRADLVQSALLQVVADEPVNYPARFLLAIAQQMKGGYADAAESYRKVLDFNPSYIPALSNLAFLLAEHLGKPEEALHIAEKARELAPGSAPVDDVFGWVLFRRGLHSLAAIHLGDAAKGGSSRALYHLAVVKWAAGDPKGARQAFQDAIRADPALPEAGVARRLLEPYAAPGAAIAMPDPLLISWADLGVSGNMAARIDLYQTSRGCACIFEGLPALLKERDPRQFTNQALLPLLMCDPQSKSPAAYFEGLGSIMAAVPRLPGLENAQAEWMDPSKPLQSFFRLSGVNTGEMPGWDNTFVSWDRDRKGILPDLGLSAVGIYQLSLRKRPGNDDPLGWDIYDSIWPKAFH